MIDLDLWNAFCEVSPWGSFLFTLQRQKKVCTPGDEAIMKIHKKLFSGIPFNLTLFDISPKLQRIWSWNFGFAIRKIWAFIWYQKIYFFQLSPGDENVIGMTPIFLKENPCCTWIARFPLVQATTVNDNHSRDLNPKIQFYQESKTFSPWFNRLICFNLQGNSVQGVGQSHSPLPCSVYCSCPCLTVGLYT